MMVLVMMITMVLVMLITMVIMLTVIIMSILPRPSPTLSLSISKDLDPIHRGANLDLNCWIHQDFRCEANMDFIVEQIWVFQYKCVCAKLCCKCMPQFGPKLLQLFKICWQISSGKSNSCPKSSLSHRPKKNDSFWTRHLSVYYTNL